MARPLRTTADTPSAAVEAAMNLRTLGQVIMTFPWMVQPGCRVLYIRVRGTIGFAGLLAGLLARK